MPGDPFIWRDAEDKLPLPELMRQLGDGVHVPSKWGGPEKNPRCPFCQSKAWSLFERDDRTVGFKCWNDGGKKGGTACEALHPPAGNGPIGYLALRKGLGNREAARTFLDMALPDRPKRERKDQSSVTSHQSPEPNPAREMKGGAFHELWKKLPLTGADIAAAFAKRGLTHETLELMGIRSNNEGNRALVEALLRDFPEIELVDLGILRETNGRIHPNGQLMGSGRTGESDCHACDTRFTAKRCPKCERKPRDEDAVWSMEAEPPLIPYFGEDGVCTYLRPHKGMVVNTERRDLEDADIPGDDDEERFECAAHVYVPPNFAELLAMSDGTAVFTEGEFKVGALIQCEIPALGCPGITFIRNPAFREELLRILRHWRVRNLVILFDNERKDDPKLPGYQPDPRRQHDAQLYAEYTREDLAPVFRAIGGTVRVGRLPDGERDAKGKADFDGILARLVAQHGATKGTEAARRLFLKCIGRATENPAGDRELFPFPGSVRVILDRRLYLMRQRREKLGSGGWRERELAKLFRQWDTQGAFSPDGTPTTEEGKPKARMVDRQLADAFAEVDGCYYVRKDCFGKDREARKNVREVLLPDLQGKINGIRAGLRGASEKEKEQKYAELRLLKAYERALRERLKGIPVGISSCTISGQFRLRKADGTTERLVHIFDHRARKRESPLFNLTSDQSASPQELRKRLLDIGRGGWGGSSGAGQEAVDKLNIQLDDDVYLCVIHEIGHCGFHDDNGIWFAGDGAFIDDKSNRSGRGILIRPDANGIFWNPFDGTGYRLDVRANDGEEGGGRSTFALGLPKFFGPHRGEDGDAIEETLFDDQLAGSDGKIHRHAGIGDLLETFIAAHFQVPETKPVRDLLQQMRDGEASPDLIALLNAAPNDLITLPDFTRPDPMTGKPVPAELSPREAMETEIARLIFAHLRDCHLETVGGMDAWLLIGTYLAYSMRPELVQQYLCQPGVFITGDFGCGKTETNRRLCGIYGMNRNKFLDLSESSPVAMGRTLAQYGGWPPPFDEYRLLSPNDPKQKLMDGILRAATQGGEFHKGTIASSTSTISTPPRTSPAVTGQNSPRDSATASRYITLIMAKARRGKGNDAAFAAIKAWCPHYYHLGRWIMERRAAFAKLALAKLRAWLGSADVKTTFADGDDRTKLVYGVAHSAFAAAGEMLGLKPAPEDAAKFREFAVSYGARSMAQVREETFRNRFWTDVVNALASRKTGITPHFFSQAMITFVNPDGKAPEKNFLLTTENLRNLCLDESKAIHVRPTNHQKHEHPVPVVFIALRPLYDEWVKDLAQRHEACPITFANLRGEIEKEAYYLPRPVHLVRKDKDEDHRQRFQIAGDETGNDRVTKPMRCICISLERTLDVATARRGDFIFPFAQRIIDALSSSMTEGEAARLDAEAEAEE